MQRRKGISNKATARIFAGGKEGSPSKLKCSNKNICAKWREVQNFVEKYHLKIAFKKEQ